MKVILIIASFLFLHTGFTKSGFNHPVDQLLKEKIDLPLKFSSRINCETCHTEHSPNNELKYLRKEYVKLCITCHEDFSNQEMNHRKENKNYSTKRCDVCHDMHNSQRKLIKHKATKLCSDCHKKQNQIHKKQNFMVHTDRAKNIIFEDDRIACTTCHATHGRPEKDHFLRDRKVLLKYCSSCHGKKIIGIFDKFHILLNK